MVGVKDTLEEMLLEGNEGIDRGVLEDIQRALEGEYDKEDGDSGSSDAGGSGNEYSEDEGETAANTRATARRSDQKFQCNDQLSYFIS